MRVIVSDPLGGAAEAVACRHAHGPVRVVVGDAGRLAELLVVLRDHAQRRTVGVVRDVGPRAAGQRKRRHSGVRAAWAAVLRPATCKPMQTYDAAHCAETTMMHGLHVRAEWRVQGLEHYIWSTRGQAAVSALKTFTQNSGPPVAHPLCKPCVHQ